MARRRMNPDVSLVPMFAVDRASDTTEVGNCWSNNRFATSFPTTLPSC